ncbi:flagellar brake protein [Salidesulfovibrio onnuriiensis]|uniref:flagellar brake protein n=1 Tax=Salidesulfovibrio onnuriiensis TaxID=2583823 RepID=UPI00202B298A|nr:flagellar brake protein [Salidesulfovibrio onnuriiensis]
MQTETAKNKTSGAAPPATENKIAKIAGVNLEVALGSDLVVMFPDAQTGYRGRIVGYDAYEYIVASLRLPKAVRDALTYKGEIVIKYLHEGTVYGFRSNILNHITRPAPLLFFTYPDSLEKLDLRKASRTSCNIDAIIFTMEGAGYDCLVLNVSETGCKVAVSVTARDPLNTMEAGEDMMVTMQLGGAGTVKLPVVVKNITKEKGNIHFGCMFLDINKEEQEQIAQYVDKIERLSK